MLKSLILLICIFPPKPPFSTLEFVRVQEEWVASLPRYKHDANLPPVFEKLKAGKYRVRQDALIRLRKQKHHVFAELIRASHHPDPNINMVATSLLERIYRCDWCQGTGECRYCRGEDAWRKECRICGFHRRCSYCTGSGDMRYEVLYLDSWQNKVIREINIFVRKLNH